MGRGVEMLLLLSLIAASLFIMGYGTVSGDFLAQYVDITGDNTSDKPVNPFTDTHNFTVRGTQSGDDFEVDVKDSVKENITDLQDTGGGVFGTSFITESFIPFIKNSVAILGVILATPYDFMFNIGLPDTIALFIATALYLLLLVAVLDYFTGRRF